jgi:hypothetical protein
VSTLISAFTHLEKHEAYRFKLAMLEGNITEQNDVVATLIKRAKVRRCSASSRNGFSTANSSFPTRAAHA